jgi:hypothetical protein
VTYQPRATPWEQVARDRLALQGRDNIQISDSLDHFCNALSGLDQKGINSVSKQIVGEVRTKPELSINQ